MWIRTKREALGARASGPLFWRTLPGPFLGDREAAGLEGSQPRAISRRIEGMRAGGPRTQELRPRSKGLGWVGPMDPMG